MELFKTVLRKDIVQLKSLCDGEQLLQARQSEKQGNHFIFYIRPWTATEANNKSDKTQMSIYHQKVESRINVLSLPDFLKRIFER